MHTRATRANPVDNLRSTPRKVPLMPTAPLSRQTKARHLYIGQLVECHGAFARVTGVRIDYGNYRRPEPFVTLTVAVVGGGMRSWYLPADEVLRSS